MNKYLLILIGVAFLLSTHLLSQTPNWHWLNPQPQGNDLRCVQSLDANTVIASGGVVIKCTNSGSAWTVNSHPVSNEKGIATMSFADPNIGGAIGGRYLQSEIYRTTDGGATWATQWGSDSIQLASISFPTPHTGFVVGSTYDPLTFSSHSKMLKTTDGGVTWQEKPVSLDAGILAGVSFADPLHGLAFSNSNTMFFTTDGGENWTYQQDFIFNGLSQVSMLDKNQALGVGNGRIIRSTDGGITWTTQATTSTWLNAGQLLDSARAVVVGREGQILLTSDGGVTWYIQESGTVRDLNAVSFVNENIGTAVGQGGTILRTTDGGLSWASQSRGILNPIYSIDFSDSLNGIAVGPSTLRGNMSPLPHQVPGRIHRTTNGGIDWTTIPDSSTRALNQISFLDPMIGLAVGDSGEIVRSTDGGENWAPETPITQTILRRLAFTSSTTGIIVGGNDFYVDIGGQTILRTTDRGVTWTGQSIDTLPGLTGVFFLDSLNGYAVGVFGIILHTTDGGISWTQQQAAEQPYILFDVSFTDVNTGIAVGDFASGIPGDAVILRTTDAGSTWTSVYSGNSFGLYRVKFIDANRGYAVGSNPYSFSHLSAIVQTTDGGVTWSDVNPPTGNNLYDIQMVHSSSQVSLFLVGDEGAILSSDETLTAANDGVVGLPSRLVLKQNYPNPFNPSTTIHYEIPARSHVTVKIYDVLGEEVAILKDEVQESGYQSVEWNASRVASGVYFYKLSATGTEDRNRTQTQVKKLVVMK